MKNIKKQMETIYHFNALKHLIKCMSDKEMTILLFMINVGVPHNYLNISHTCNAVMHILYEFSEDDLEIVNMYITKSLHRSITNKVIHNINKPIDDLPPLLSLTERLNTPLDQLADPADDELYDTTVKQLDKDLENYMKKGSKVKAEKKTNMSTTEWKEFIRAYDDALLRMEGEPGLYFDIQSRKIIYKTAKHVFNDELEICSRNAKLFEWVENKIKDEYE